MAAKPKLTPEEWAEARKHWENDSREGYAWLIAELELPVSGPAVRKAALRDGWAKAEGAAAAEKPAAPSAGEGKPAPKRNTKKAAEAKAATKATASTQRAAKRASKVSKVSESHKVSETMSKAKTIETLPTTTMDALEEDPDQFGALEDLTDMQEVFVREYMTDWNGTKAAIRAGYSPKSASEIAYQLLQKTPVRDAIQALASVRARRLGIDADGVMMMWAAIIELDANELSQLRRVCCPYCHGENHERQYTPSGLESARLKHERERQRRLKADQNDDIGDFPEYEGEWYDKRLPPAEDCPECHGEGVEEVWFADTRHLSPAARLAYSGVKVGRDGIEVLTMSKEKAADNLARALGLFKDKEAEVNINMVASEDLYRVFDEKMQAARERQARIMEERGMLEDGRGGGE
ncbi:terminase small subunit [Alcaligenes phenolicus]|uniref:terminase small subunit n=1 Tax=Alcaligenes phenolicus TaxID=232846 RepID=UPI002AA81B74|nr:terminase small subunit [Alcaligenes phenolicus]